MSTQAAVETLEFDLRIMTSEFQSLLILLGFFLSYPCLLLLFLIFVQTTGSMKEALTCFTSVSPLASRPQSELDITWGSEYL